MTLTITGLAMQILVTSWLQTRGEANQVFSSSDKSVLLLLVVMQITDGFAHVNVLSASKRYMRKETCCLDMFYSCRSFYNHDFISHWMVTRRKHPW